MNLSTSVRCFVGLPGEVTSIATCDDNLYLSSKNKIFCYDLRRPEAILKDYTHSLTQIQQQGQVEEINQIAISLNKKILASCSDAGDIALFNLETNALQSTLFRHENVCASIAFRNFQSATQPASFLSDNDTTTTLTTTTITTTTTTSTSTATAISMECTSYLQLLSGGLDAQVIQWDLSTGHAVHNYKQSLEPDDQSGQLWNPPFVHSVAVTPTGSHCASALGSGSVAIFDLDSVQQIETVSGHTAGVSQVIFPKFAPNTHFVSGGNDAKIVVYKAGFDASTEQKNPGTSTPPQYQQKKKKKQKVKKSLNKVHTPSTIQQTVLHGSKINWLESSSLTSPCLYVADQSDNIHVYIAK